MKIGYLMNKTARQLSLDSRIEEVISSLGIIAALLAYNGGLKWLSLVIMLKALMDMVGSILLAFASKKASHSEIKKEGP